MFWLPIAIAIALFIGVAYYFFGPHTGPNVRADAGAVTKSEPSPNYCSPSRLGETLLRRGFFLRRFQTAERAQRRSSSLYRTVQAALTTNSLQPEPAREIDLGRDSILVRAGVIGNAYASSRPHSSILEF